MKLHTAVIILAPVATAYNMNGFSYGPGYESMPNMAARQQGRAEFRRQPAENVNRALADLANELNKEASKVKEDPHFKVKQKAFMNNAFDFFTTEMGFDKDDAQQLRDITNKGFEVAQDIMSGSYSPAYDVHDTETDLEIAIDVPGVEKSSIDIIVEDGVLTVSGSRDVGRDIPKRIPFSKSFPLDKTVDTDKLSASLNSGVLLIRAPKKLHEKSPGKRINIQ
jgi:HSP20 family protein